ncbi:MAG TPA: hypothetical protein PLJ27_01000 [Polyangiaceae bacterium]|nr:hypothetical protein [Polyangiaceae bacterium]
MIRYGEDRMSHGCSMRLCATHRIAVLLSTSVVACGGYVDRGRNLYEQGRYIESAEVLQHYEQEIGSEPPSRQAEYATYRGLSMLVLGNYEEARRWMFQAYAIGRTYPGSILPAWQRDLDRGWRQLQPHLLSPQGQSAPPTR